MRVLAVIFAVTSMAVVAFVVGFVCGQDAGGRRARAVAYDACMEWARLALHGHEKWRAISPAAALSRAAQLLCPERRS